MELSQVRQLLSRTARPLSLSVVHREKYTTILCDELYRFSRGLVGEDRAHWQHHVDTCTEAHLLRCAGTGTLLGFQFWRRDTSAAVPIIWGGKLRFSPEIRRQGVHLALNLLALDGMRRQHAQHAPVYRVSLCNVFGFQALRPGLEAFVPPRMPATVAAVVSAELNRFVEENGFKMCRSTGRVNVGQDALQSPEDLPESFWGRPEVAEFRTAGLSGSELSRPATLSRLNDCFLVWEWSNANVAAMRDRLYAKLGTA
ncbi:unnamed protein product [Prorocentrum cordatum]|uniref:N-acetyltransferase domain-containing protein n=1 Tax=Prorocentrum cordatum TaxID=2364126 RepID=A0ABN9WTE2_9DINO|nr:unnamed protein product [Polarella glacialis]